MSDRVPYETLTLDFEFWMFPPAKVVVWFLCRISPLVPGLLRPLHSELLYRRLVVGWIRPEGGSDEDWEAVTLVGLSEQGTWTKHGRLSR